jgi:hypothetical protein
MKRLVVWVVAFMFLFSVSAFAQEKIAPKKTKEVKTFQEQTTKGDQDTTDKKVEKKGVKPKKQKKAKTIQEQTTKGDQDTTDKAVEKKGVKPKKTKKVKTFQEQKTPSDQDDKLKK